MHNIRKLVVGQLQSNCYLLINTQINQLIIIDPGDDAEYIIQSINDTGATPQKIIATHGHFDHILAVTELQLAFNIPFLIHEKDKFLVKRLNETSKHFTGVESGPGPKINQFLTDGQKISLGNINFQILQTPGHTPGSICLYTQRKKLAFVGDLIFAGGGVGRTDFSYSNETELNKSLSKILKLPKQTIIYPGHGPESNIGQEKLFHK